MTDIANLYNPQKDYDKGSSQSNQYSQGDIQHPYGEVCIPNQMSVRESQQQYSHLYHPHHMLPQQQQSNTTVIINQPTNQNQQTKRILGPRDGHRDWGTGLFSCCDDVGKCMWTLFCPTCVIVDVSARMGECCCVTCCVPAGLITVRTRVRTLGGIKGSICKDCMATTCCQMCVLCQLQRELDYMGL